MKKRDEIFSEQNFASQSIKVSSTWKTSRDKTGVSYDFAIILPAGTESTKEKIVELSQTIKKYLFFVCFTSQKVLKRNLFVKY